MAYSGYTAYYLKPGVDVNVPGATPAQVQASMSCIAAGDLSGMVLVDDTTYPTTATTVLSVGGCRVDYEGEDEAITDGTVQVFTTLQACYLANAANPCVINIYDTSAAGTLLFGPITMEASKERIIVFPTPLVSVGGIFFHTPTGALTSGIMIGA